MNSQRSLYQQMVSKEIKQNTTLQAYFCVKFDTPPTPVLKARPASDLLIPIAAPDDSQQMHVRFFSGFKKPVSDTELHIELEEKNRTIIMLNSLLQKKDQEISMLKADLEDSVSELGTVCDVTYILFCLICHTELILGRNSTLSQIIWLDCMSTCTMTTTWTTIDHIIQVQKLSCEGCLRSL